VGERGAVIAMHSFGASAPYKALYENFGFTVDKILSQARQLM
jgi:transketolase